jgi:signal transduction histidine kinase
MKAESAVVRVKRRPQGASARGDYGQLLRLLQLAQEMGGPLNVVQGRMEYLLDRKLDRETRRSLTAILSKAKELIDLRQQLIDEASTGVELAGSVPSNGTAGSSWG